MCLSLKPERYKLKVMLLKSNFYEPFLTLMPSYDICQVCGEMLQKSWL